MAVHRRSSSIVLTAVFIVAAAVCADIPARAFAPLQAPAPRTSQQPATQQPATQRPALQPASPGATAPRTPKPTPAQAPAPAPAPRTSPRQQTPMDPARARRLYVPTDPQFQSVGHDYARDVAAREQDDARYVEICKGIIDYQKITYRSSAGGMEIPAYLFQPLQRRGAKGHAALVWVHGGVHGRWASRCSRSSRKRSIAATS